MKNLNHALGVLAVSATAATAGGLDRSGQSVGVIFETGNYAEFSFGAVNPQVTGTAAPVLGGFSSGDMAGNYNQVSGAVKFSLGQNLDAAVIIDQPFGANVAYPVLALPPAVYYAAGSVAILNTTAITGVLKYRTPSNISVFGGLRYETMDAKATVPFVVGYNVTGERDGALGYLVGVAFEKPEIALRVALTYNSKIKHELATSETSSLFPTLTSITSVNSPQSVNLEAQSGIAKDTLLFGSIRWVDWSSFEIDPANYPPADPLVSYGGDIMTYTLGVGRRLNENWAVAASINYDTAIGGFSSNLGPTDGKRGLTLGATYTKDNFKITGGVSYVKLGDTQTTLDDTNAAADFNGNRAIGVGIKVGFTF